MEPGAGDGQHHCGDVRELFGQHWDLIIAFPPCDHLSLAGAVYWKAKQADGRQQAGADFFMEMVRAPASFVAVENPRGVMSRLYRPPDQVVQPWWFGDPYAKATCLWLKGLPRLEADDRVDPIGRVAAGGGSWRTDQAYGRGANNSYEDSAGRKNRSRMRGLTMPGIARAMASQWGLFVEARVPADR